MVVLGIKRGEHNCKASMVLVAEFLEMSRVSKKNFSMKRSVKAESVSSGVVCHYCAGPVEICCPVPSSYWSTASYVKSTFAHNKVRSQTPEPRSNAQQLLAERCSECARESF